MSEFFKAELKDRFLQYAMDRDDYFEVQLLYDEFLRPNYSLGYAQKLVKEIVDYDADLLDVMSGNGINYFMVSATDDTEDFLEEGGFTDLFVKEEEKWDTFLEHLSYNIKATSKESMLLSSSKKQLPKKERHLLLLLVSAVAISFVFTVFSLMKAFFVKEDYVTKQELQNVLKELQTVSPYKQQSDKELRAEYLEEHVDSLSLSPALEIGD